MNRQRLFAGACAGMFLFGAVVALLGTLFGLPEMRARLGVNFAQQGQLFSIMSVGLLIATALSGPIMDRFGHKTVLVSSSLLSSVGLIAVGMSRSVFTAALSVFLLGFGAAGLNTAPNAVVSDLYPEERGRRLNLVGVFFGVGALFVPLLKAAAFEWLSIGGLIAVMVAMSAACGVLYLSARFPPPHAGAGVRLTELLKAAAYPGVIVFALLLLAQAGNEATLSGWTTTYIGERGWPARTATAILAGYWTAVIVGRTFFSRVSGSFEKKWIVTVSGFVATVACAALMASPSLVALTAAVLVASFAFSGIYPTTLAMVGDRYPKYAGTVFGFVFTVAGLGNMIAPAIVGFLSQAYSVSVGMVVPLIGSAIVTGIAALIRRKA